MSGSTSRDRCVSILTRWAAVGALLLSCVSTTGAQAPAAHKDITYILPLWYPFGSATSAAIDAEVQELRSRIGEGQYVKVGFTAYVFVDMTSWTVDITNPAAVRAALATTFAQIDNYVAKAEAAGGGMGIPICLNILTAIRDRTDPVQLAAEAEDRRNVQWYGSDNVAATGWLSHSRYARKSRAIQEAYTREIGRYLAQKMAENPATLVAASGDGEVELSYFRSPIKFPDLYTEATTDLADYSPFAVAEFRDWLRNAGLYAPAQPGQPAGPYAGEGYELSSRYAGDATPGTDTNGDGRTLNSDFGTSFTSWNLRYADWALSDWTPGSLLLDPNAIPLGGPVTNGGLTRFDAPRVRTPGNAWWEVWSLFRQTLIAHHNKDFAKWITTTPDDSNNKVPADRWFSYQIPTDYLFGSTPVNPNFRFVTSASPLWSADVSPYGGMGVTAFNVNQGGAGVNGPYARTLAGLAPAIAAYNVRWAILEWNPSEPVSTNPAPIYQDEMVLVERYRPSVLVPYVWPFDAEGRNKTKGTGFETAMKELVTRIADVPGTCTYSIPSSASFLATGGTGSIAVTASSTTGAGCPWTATSDPWITFTSSATGTNSGTVSYTVASNGTAIRLGKITIAQRTTTVTQAAPPISITFPNVLAAGPDFATDVLKDAWDMSNVQDVSQDPNERVGFTNFAVANGLAGGTTTTVNGAQDSFVKFLHGGRNPSAYINIGRNGINFPIDTAKYTKLALRISDSGTGEIPQVFWDTDQGVGFRLLPPTGNGFRILSSDLSQQNDKDSVLWTAAPVRGFRIDPNSQNSGQRIFFDWVRLTYADNIPGAKIQNIVWTGGGGPATIIVTDASGTAITIATNATSPFAWNYGILPPGSYTLSLTSNDGTSNTKTFVINDPPSIRVTSPSRTTGADYATTVVGNPWDMGSAADVQATENLDDITFANGKMTATSTAAGATIMLLNGNNNSTPIDTSKYRYLTYIMQVDGGFDPAAGSFARLAWNSGQFFSVGPSLTKGIVNWPGNNTYTIDLAALGAGGLIPSLDRVWTDGNKTFLRLDPHAFAGRSFTLDDVKLTANPATNGTYAIQFSGRDLDNNGLTVNLYADIDRDPTNSNWIQIASGLSLSGSSAIADGVAADGTHNWNTTGVSPNTYYIYAEASDGVQAKGSYGDAPIEVSCSYSLSATSASATAAGGTATVNVASATGCAWTAAPNSSFLSVSSGATGTGNGTVGFSVAANPNRTSRTGTLTIAGQTFTLTQAGNIRVPFDFSGDRKADLAVFNPSTGAWTIKGQATVPWGLSGDVPVPGDYNGDASADVAVYRPSSGHWFILGQAPVQFGLTDDVPVPGDYNGDRTTDIAVYRPSTGQWFVRGGGTFQWGLPNDVPVPADYDGDGKTDLAVFRPSSGGWFVAFSSTSFTTFGVFVWGENGDLPTPGDFDGDGKADLAVFRPSNGLWFLALSATNYATNAVHAWGIPGDLPLALDIDGDGTDELAVFRPSDASWWTVNRVTSAITTETLGSVGGIPAAQRPRLPVRVACSYTLSATSASATAAGGSATVNVTTTAGCAWTAASNSSFLSVSSGASGSGNGTVTYSVAPNATASARTGTLTIAGQTFTLTQAGSIRVPFDFSGDRKADLAAFNPSTGGWAIKGQANVQWGLSGDVPVPGDYNRDGVADIAVYRPSGGLWFVRDQSGLQWGLPTDVPVPGDYTGDRQTDIAVYRPSTGQWFVRGVGTFQWGLPNDVPVPADYDGDGKTDLAVFRPSTGVWFLAFSSTSFGTNGAFVWGETGDLPTPGDFDGDGKADLAVFRPSNGLWFLALSATNYASNAVHAWGIPGDLPLALDIDGDGTDELAVFRPWDASWWTFNRVTSAITTETLGSVGGIPAAQRPRLPVQVTCSYALSAISASAPAAGGTATVTVTTTAGCAWTAASNSSFLSVSSGASGTGSGAVTYAVAANATATTRAGTLTIAGQTFTLTQPGSIRVPFDFSGDGKADLAAYHPTTGLWSIKGQANVQWGLSGDVPVPGDYNGDGVGDVAVYRPSGGLWFVRDQGVVQWGLPTDVPVPGDYNGDRTTDTAVYRPSTGQWFVRGVGTFQWGLPNDVPAPADYDGDGKTDLAVYRPSTGVWFLAYSSTSFTTFGVFGWGVDGDLPTPGDFDGDGKADLAVFRPSNGLWFLALSATSYATNAVHAWGIPGDLPLALDIDGDGTDEVVVFRPSDASWWTFNRVTSAITTETFGSVGGRPAAQRPRLP